ncbi:tetratricopeptide repeat protein [uncultured Deinococcus sp.]|uniref:tetratricopeptide repeat protein n=1 Tax=uncultured Deinococcus sp. TaxID=158789 RepID=UPI002587FF5E|nr:tetratricopeptide repeat protein [uncultured Deinococcus sp.]
MQSVSRIPVRLAALLSVALACGPASAQSLVETVTTTSIQNTLNTSALPGTLAVPAIPQAQQEQSAQGQAAQTSGQSAAAASATAAGTPAVTVTPLSAAQQAALTAAQTDFTAGRYAQARAGFEALVAQNYSNPAPHFGLALTLLAQKDDKGAAFEFTQFQVLSPASYEGPYNLGVLASRAGRFDDALKFYQDAAALARTANNAQAQALALEAVAGEQTRRADFASLSTTLTDLAALQPGNGDVQFRLAQARTLAGQGVAALPGLYALLQREPGRVDAASLLADIYVAQGLPERALRELSAAVGRVANGTARSALLLQQAGILATTGDLRAAIFAARDARTADTRNVAAYVREGQLRLQNKDRAGALSAYQAAAQLAPKDAAARTSLAALRLDLGQTAQATQDAALALTLSPDTATRARAQFVQGVGLYRQGQYARARTLLASSAAATPSAETSLWLGLSSYALKDYKGAVSALQASVQASPSAEARRNLASALLADARYTEAETVARGLVTDSPKDAEAWYLLGLSQRSQRRDGEARQSLRTAANLGNVRAREALK